MNGITPGKNDAVQQHNVSDFEFANIGVGKGRVQADHLSGRQSQVRHRFLLLKFVRRLGQRVAAPQTETKSRRTAGRMQPAPDTSPCACHLASRIQAPTPTRFRATPAACTSITKQYCRLLCSQPPPSSMSRAWMLESRVSS